MKSANLHTKQCVANFASSKTSRGGIALTGVPVLQQKENSEEPIQQFSAQQKNTTQFASGADDTKPLKPFQLKPNNTGLPDNLKSGVENLSGMSLDHVKVHYNSSQPAQLNALAYAQGSDIHVGPGQEKHLPHEAWHVVQQAQGRVQATKQMKANSVYDKFPVQRYAIPAGKKHDKIADDGKMYVEGNKTGNLLYAQEEVIGFSEGKLEESGSAVKLVGGENKRIGDKDLKKVSLNKRVGNTAFAHKDQCIDQGLEVMNAKRATAFQSDDHDIYPMVLNHMMGLQGKEDGNGDEDKMTAFAQTRKTKRNDLGDTYQAIKGLYYWAINDVAMALPGKWEALKDKFKTGGKRKKKIKISDVPALIAKLKAILQNKADDDDFPEDLTIQNIDHFKAFMDGETGTRNLLSAHNPDEEVAGLNELAKPQVGEAYLTVTAGENYKNNTAWNFHWGAVVMKSGEDTVTTESFANNENLRGIWDMYGTRKHQSFHEQHKAGREHGKDPVTVATRINAEKLVMGSQVAPPEVVVQYAGIYLKMKAKIEERLTKKSPPKYLKNYKVKIYANFKTDVDFNDHIRGSKIDAIYEPDATSARHFVNLFESVKN